MKKFMNQAVSSSSKNKVTPVVSTVSSGPVPVASSTPNIAGMDEEILKSATSTAKHPFGQVIEGSPVPIIRHTLPLRKFVTAAEGKEPLENLRKGVQERITSKSKLNAYLLGKQTGFRTLLANREHVMNSHSLELEAMKLKLKQTDDERKQGEGIVKKLQGQVEEATEEKIAVEALNSSLRDEVVQCTLKIETLQQTHRDGRDRLARDLELQRKMDNVKAERLRQQGEAKVRAECKVKDRAIAAVRELVNAGDSNQASDSHYHRRLRPRRRPTQYTPNFGDEDVGRQNYNSGSESDIDLTVIKSPAPATHKAS